MSHQATDEIPHHRPPRVASAALMSRISHQKSDGNQRISIEPSYTCIRPYRNTGSSPYQML
ncbi:hypothetical protein BCR34DRAFT_205163 [Clohesyomyces aquaticus]|uniref:Uncharacterized protein n=1 Tax=Clohesyomyces aquaticus TaxID=1231657 RepID=A0A1Y1YA88_9PLEO|nr:hypothetical protein BCR34DRAFT_205163 [Clohesyomyces aquaticus]